MTIQIEKNKINIQNYMHHAQLWHVCTVTNLWSGEFHRTIYVCEVFTQCIKIVKWTEGPKMCNKKSAARAKHCKEKNSYDFSKVVDFDSFQCLRFHICRHPFSVNFRCLWDGTGRDEWNRNNCTLQRGHTISLLLCTVYHIFIYRSAHVWMATVQCA